MEIVVVAVGGGVGVGVLVLLFSLLSLLFRMNDMTFIKA